MSTRMLCLSFLIGFVMHTNNSGIELKITATRPIAYFRASYEEAHTTRLSDSPAINKKKTGTIWRDAFGREREEQHVEIEPGIIEITAYIQDPVARVQYLLDLKARTILSQGPLSEEGFRARTWSLDNIGIAIPLARPTLKPDYDLRILEGLRCEGYVINQPGKCRVEYWYSSDLDHLMLVRIANIDEEIVWRLFDIQYTKPDEELFTAPAGYKPVQY